MTRLIHLMIDLETRGNNPADFTVEQIEVYFRMTHSSAFPRRLATTSKGHTMYAILTNSPSVARNPTMYPTEESAIEAFRVYLRTSLGWGDGSSQLTIGELFEMWTSKFGGTIVLVSVSLSPLLRRNELLEAVANLERKLTEADTYTQGWNDAIGHTLNILKKSSFRLD